jgi:hypothetical protein
MLNYRGVGASSEARGAALPPDARGYTLDLLAADVAAVADAEGLDRRDGARALDGRAGRPGAVAAQ